MSEESLKDKTVRGVGWSFADNIASTGITFLVGLVLARLLTPEEYGLIGIIAIFIAVSNSIVNSGFSSALIRKKQATGLDYDTVFLFNILLSAFMFGVLYVGAPLISGFFGEPQLIPLTRVMGIVLVINAFALVQQTILVKKIDFKTQTKISLIASIISGVVGIGMAIGKCGVWSLVGQQIARQCINTALLWVLNTWRPTLRFSVQSFAELFSFGWKLLVSGLIDTIWKQVYQIVIGKWYTTEALGQYTRAEQFSSIFSVNLTNVVQRVSYPALSTIQDEQQRLKLAYKRVIKTTMLVTFVCMLGLAAVAKPMVLVLIGEKWLPAVGFLQIICFSAMLYPLHAINLNMLQVKGRSDLFLKLEILKKTIAIGPVLLGIFIGIKWMLWGSVLVGFISYYLNSYYTGRELNYTIKEQITDILPSFWVAALMAIVVYALSYIPITPFVLLPFQLIVGFTLVILLCEKRQAEEYLEIKSIVFPLLNKIHHG